MRQKHELAIFADVFLGESGQRHFINCIVHFLICMVCDQEDPVVDFKVYLISW